MQIKEYIDKNFEVQNRISSISKQYLFIKEHPFENSLFMIFNLLETSRKRVKKKKVPTEKQAQQEKM